MRLHPSLFLLLSLALPCRADGPPSDQPGAWLPAAGSAWIATRTPGDGVPGLTFGMRPIRPLVAAIRQGDAGAEADFAVELADGRGALPLLVLDSRGHGGSRTERLDSLLLGARLGEVEASSGLARAGDGGLHPLLHLRLAVQVMGVRGWLSGGLGGPDGAMVEAAWPLEPGTMVSLGWRRDRGLVAGAVFQLAGAAYAEPLFGLSRRADGGRFTDIGPFQSAGAAFHAGLPQDAVVPPRVMLSSHRLGLPGVAVGLLGPDLEALRRHRLSAAELRRNARFSRADTPDDLVRHWELQLDATSELEPGARGDVWASRLSAGARLHLLPFAELILTGEGRVATAAYVPWPRWEPPSAGRDDAALYLHRRFSLDRAQMAYVRALSPSLDLLVEGGHLDPIYGGGGAELRYQPLKARWSLGAVAHHVWKRPPTVQTIYRGTGRTTGFVTAGWEGRDGGTRTELALGRYLAGDWGGSFTLSRQFGSGLELGLDGTATVKTTRLGLSLTMPLAGLGGHVETLARLRVRPMAREHAERLDRAVSLSDLRFAAGYGRVSHDWDQGLRRGW
ncbi:YjbH domain-containing protein [Niveispirillum sp. KHB5.9]|uniref:YjbH domain-containing protein n=1 Tax=Niveispirillum sp. KHB5.9 TaxID=3400269 RepID=UPI003A8B2257